MLVKELSQEKITKISLGFYHAAALNDSFQMFTWGRGINGQLGHGDIYNELSVKQVAQFQGQKITDIACGESHTMALNTQGEVYTWGGG